MARPFIYWATPPLIRDSKRITILSSTVYDNASKIDKTEDLHDYLRLVARSNLNFIVSWFGMSGYGKSYSLLSVVESLLKYKGEETKININNCCFTITDMQERIGEIEKGAICILDEQIGSSNIGSNIERIAMANIETTVRSHKLCFFYSSPNLVVHNYHFYFETWEMGSLSPWDFERPIEEQWKFTKSIVFDSKANLLGYVVTRTPQDKDFLEKYEKKKDIFITDVRKMQTDKRHMLIDKKAEELLANPKFIDMYRYAPNKPMKGQLVRRFLRGFMFSVVESNILVDTIDYNINFEKKYSKIRDIIIEAKKEIKKVKKR